LIPHPKQAYNAHCDMNPRKKTKERKPEKRTHTHTHTHKFALLLYDSSSGVEIVEIFLRECFVLHENV